MGPTKQRLGGDAARTPARPLRAGRPAALRAGQVVSRRVAAALGVHLLLADRRRAAVARPGAASPTPTATTASDRRRRASASPRRWPSAWPSARTTCIAAYEDPLAYIHQRAPAAGQRGPGAQHARRSGRARAPAPRVQPRPRTPTGFVLPLARGWGQDGPEWQSGLWMLRARHLFLVPGDSPVGLRLPLESLPAEPWGEARGHPDRSDAPIAAAATSIVAEPRKAPRTRVQARLRVLWTHPRAQEQHEQTLAAPRSGEPASRSRTAGQSRHGTDGLGVPATGGLRGRLRRVARRRRGHGPRARHARCCSRDTPRPTMPGSDRSKSRRTPGSSR